MISMCMIVNDMEFCVRKNKCHFSGITAFLLASCLSIGLLENAQADYFVRPFIQVGGGSFIDNRQVNGDTYGAQKFCTEFESEVDLANGNPASVVMDFTNTGAFDTLTPTGITYTSDSGGISGFRRDDATVCCVTAGGAFPVLHPDWLLQVLSAGGENVNDVTNKAADRVCIVCTT